MLLRRGTAQGRQYGADLDAEIPHPRVAALRQSNAELEARNASLMQALDALRASTSWRITAPMRALRRSLGPRQIRSMRQE